MGELHSLPEIYYEKSRADGVEAGNAYEAMRLRFPGFKGVPAEVAAYRDVLADDYQEDLCGERYEPTDPYHMRLADDLAEQGAFARVGENRYVPTDEGKKAGYTEALARWRRDPKRTSDPGSDLVDDDLDTEPQRATGDMPFLKGVCLLVLAYLVFRYL